jgi:hypothetical protein
LEELAARGDGHRRDFVDGAIGDANGTGFGTQASAAALFADQFAAKGFEFLTPRLAGCGGILSFQHAEYARKLLVGPVQQLLAELRRKRF